MALPLPAQDHRTARFSFLRNGVAKPCFPRSQGNPKLTREPGEESAKGAFYYRSKLSALTFTGNDYLRLLEIEQSTDRCQSIGLLLETRPNPYEPWQHEEQFVFTCNEIAWDYAACTATVTPTTNDAYRIFLESYDREYNLLGTPGNRTQVTAELASLAGAIRIEFLRTDTDAVSDLLGTDGWATFLTNTSWISGGSSGGTREKTILLFRYRLKDQPMTTTTTGGSTTYAPVDRSGDGWTVLDGTENTTAHTIDYVKAPAIAGFKPYKIGTYNDWNDPLNLGSTRRYGDQLLVLPCGGTPSQFGYPTNAYLQVTGTGGGQSLGGAHNDDPLITPCLNLRRTTSIDLPRSVWWKFGEFKFGRCFPLLDGLYYLLQQVATASGQPGLLPLTPAGLSNTFSQDPNPATGETGAANEMPRLLLSAASDVKRYGASEPASRLLVSLKQLLADLSALYDVGWFIDAGKFRLEHRAYLETARAAGSTLDLTALPDAQLPEAYAYRTGQLPRYEELTVSSATTEGFDKASLDYGTGGCVNGREGQNKTTATSARLSGDVAGMVLSGEAIPDSAIALLAPGTAGTLSDANRPVAARYLLRRYHRRGAALAGATVDGQLLAADSLRPTRLQENLSVPLCSLRSLDGTTHLTTSLGPDGQLAKGELDLLTGVALLSANMPPVAPTGPAPDWNSRDFADQFTEKFS